MNNIVLATANQHKVREFQQLVGDRLCFHSVPGNIVFPPENGNSFLENANIKALAVARQTGYYALADDSGLLVDALGGKPGLFSSRYAGKNATDEENRKKLLQDLSGISERSAKFVCVLSLAAPWGEILGNFYGEVKGSIGYEERGEKGFGYDPLFFPEGGIRSFAEILEEEKNKISHRARAVQQLLSSHLLDQLLPLWRRLPGPEDWQVINPMENSLILEYGKLIWTVKRGTLWNQANNAINLCRFIHPLIYAAINCTVYHVPCCHGEQAGIYCFYDQDHYIKWVQERLDGQIWLVVAKEYKGDGELICRFPWEEGKVCLRCELGNGKVRFLARHQGDQGYWVEFQECDLSCFSFFKKGPEFLLAAHGHQQDDRVVRATLDNIQFVGILK